jgi:hypothetical protein
MFGFAERGQHQPRSIALDRFIPRDVGGAIALTAPRAARAGPILAVAKTAVRRQQTA